MQILNETGFYVLSRGFFQGCKCLIIRLDIDTAQDALTGASQFLSDFRGVKGRTLRPVSETTWPGESVDVIDLIPPLTSLVREKLQVPSEQLVLDLCPTLRCYVKVRHVRSAGHVRHCRIVVK